MAATKRQNKKPTLASSNYYVCFDDYLKPKSVTKPQKSLLLAKQAVPKPHLRLKLLEHPVLIAAGSNTKWTLLQEKFKGVFQPLKKIKQIKLINKIFTKFTRDNIKVPKFMNFLSARNDHVTCKRKSGFEIYCEIASIHGFNNFVGATTWQRAFWFFLILSAVIMSGFVLLLSHLLNINTPVILYSESTQYPTWSIPFPAVTICNLNAISKSKAEQWAQKFQTTTNLTQNDIIKYFNLALSTTENIMADLNDYRTLKEILKANNYSLAKLLDNIAPNCDKQLRRCSFNSEIIKCDHLFKKTHTSFGPCCSFNYRPLKETLSKRTDYAANDHVYISNCGYIAGLSVLLDPQLEDYKASTTLTRGYRILIHDTHDFPDTTSLQRIITPGTSNKVSVLPYQIYATTHINSLGINSRKCYLPNERKMYHFGSYSQVNCLAECRSLMIYKKCGCALPYRPKMYNWSVCELENIPCYLQHKHLLVSDLKHAPANSNDEQFICDCYPLCDVHIYNIALTSGGLTRKYSLTEKRFYRGINVTNNNILLRVFINDLYAERTRLDVYENWLSFLGTFGGITALFMGYSFLSGFELIFFVLVRPACNWVTKKQIQYRIKKRLKKTQQTGRRQQLKNTQQQNVTSTTQAFI